MAESYRIAALEKGLQVLACFSSQRRHLGPSAVAKLSGLPVSTCYRILRTLEASGFVEQGDDGSFTPGPSVLKLGFAALQNNEVVEAARVPLKELQKETRETCNFAVLSGVDIIYLLRFKTEHYMISNVVAGSSLPAVCTALGKVLLASLSETEFDETSRTIDYSNTSLGPKAHKSRESLATEIVVTRQREWAIQDREMAHGLRAIAVPVFNIDGIAGAIGISVEADRWTQASMIEDLLPSLQEAAQKTSLRMGYLAVAKPSRCAGS